MKTKHFLISAAVVIGSALTTTLSLAEEVTLRAVSAFADGTTFTRNFQRFIEEVNERGKGVVQIEYRGGGGKVMNPFQLGDAIRTGVVDIGNLPGAFYTKLLPEADVMKLSDFTIKEERENGGWAFMNELHNSKMNTWHLARQKDCVPFHLYLTKKIDKPDLTGFNIRVTPIYRAFFESMGASMIRTKPGDVYTALERGTVDGYGWPTQGVLDLGWHEVTKYRVDPAFYRASVEVLVNLDAWSNLTDAQRQVLQNGASWMENLCTEDEKINLEEKTRQAGAGIETIDFGEETSSAYLKQAYDTGWAAFIAANPETGPKLKELLTR